MKLKEVIAMYLLFREATGRRSTKMESGLKAFCRLMGNEIDITEVDVEKVEGFLTGIASKTRSWHDRHNTLRAFYQYAVSRRYIASSPLPKLIPKRPQPFVPYIYLRANCNAFSTPPALSVNNASLNRKLSRTVAVALWCRLASQRSSFPYAWGCGP
ncbi:MAG TPA: hypothetical protein VMM84_12105 [Pyrinomonadaceae bacterium]|nr:hypothetical protein [Pyrinomonadaceae bacterium]